MQLDHIMFATNDLDTGIKHVESLTGVKAEYGGSHPGGGTRNALLSFGGRQYLEILAPDPHQESVNTLGQSLGSKTVPFIRTWAVAVSGFDTLKGVLHQSGYGCNIIDMSRTRPDGVQLKWQLLFVEGHEFGLAMPFFIDWLESPHPSDQAPGGCELISFSVLCPEADKFNILADSIGLEVEVSAGEKSFAARMNTPKGLVTLH
ncbi:MAG: VOC family protein [Gammaproteobacteria bacterium]|nr:VOC family protein [Gammaproteobacteria bacterium]